MVGYKPEDICDCVGEKSLSSLGLKIIFSEIDYSNFKILVTHRDPVELVLSNIGQNLLMYL